MPGPQQVIQGSFQLRCPPAMQSVQCSLLGCPPEAFPEPLSVQEPVPSDRIHHRLRTRVGRSIGNALPGPLGLSRLHTPWSARSSSTERCQPLRPMTSLGDWYTAKLLGCLVRLWDELDHMHWTKVKMPTVGLEPTTIRLRAVRSAN